MNRRRAPRGRVPSTGRPKPTSHPPARCRPAPALLFGLYILAFYAGSALDGHVARWNEQLPRLYEAQTPAATAGMGLHFAAGGLILVLGGVQLVPHANGLGIRALRRARILNRVTGG